MNQNKQHEASFRDNCGYVFVKDNVIYRRVNSVYKKNYDLLMESGLYKKLVDKKMLVPHVEVDSMEFFGSDNRDVYKCIKPRQIPYISYPYEWSFSQYKDAAILTLEIQKMALENGMTLKDASAYNIQFFEGKPVFIDTLSFEKYEKGKAWIAYQQFCQHFLAPLALMAYTDVRLSVLMRDYIDGIPLDLASQILPMRTRFKPSIMMHIHMHAKSQKKYADKKVGEQKSISAFSLNAIIDGLQNAVQSLKWNPVGTEWGEYYTFTNYSDSAFQTKKDIIKSYIQEANPQMVWDIGANNGEFSALSSEKGIFTVAYDIDSVAVEKGYLRARESGEKNLLPLFLDLTNPTPGIGWQNTERSSFIDRGPVDMVYALALIHHISISHNMPFYKVAEMFAKISKWLVIEFVPKEDSQVQKLLQNREDIFPQYTKEYFEKEFKKYFEIHRADKVEGSLRTLYLMKKI